MALPEFLKPTGLHFSFHASGQCHIKTEQPKFSVGLPNFNELAMGFQEQAISLLESVIRPPRQGYPALILMLPHPERFVVRPIQNRHVIDCAAAFDASSIAVIDDTANLAPALQQLKTKGYINSGTNVVIMTESGEISTYRPLDAASNIDHIPSSGWLREVAKYQGAIVTFDNQNGEPPELVKSVFKPLFNPIQEVVDVLSKAETKIGQSPKLERFERLLENISTQIGKKEPIRID